MKLILKLVAGLLTLLIIAAIAIPMFISAEYLKGQLITQVKNATGRELAIKGDASLTIFPNIAISVHDVTLGNPAGFSSKYFAHVEKLEAGAALKPLLSKELRITGIDVEGAVLNLEENANGKNWEFAAKKAAAGEKPEPVEPGEKKASPLKQLQIGDVVLKKSAVNIIKAGEKTKAVSDIDLTIKGADGSVPLKIDGSVKYQGETAKLKVDLEKSKAFLAGKSSPVELALEVPSGKVEFKGAAVNKDTGLSAEGNLDVTIDNLPKLMQWATGKAASGGLPKKIALNSGLFVQNPQAFALKEMKLAADALSTTGSLAINLAGAVPSIQGTLNFGELDLDALSKKPTAAPSTGGDAAPAAAASSGSEGWSTSPIDASGLRSVNGDLKVSIGTLKSGKLLVEKIAGEVALSGGVLKLNLANASLYSGTMKGTVSVDGSGSGVGVGTGLNISGVQVEPLMTALTGGSRMSGVAALSVNVNGRGTSQRAIVNSLSGNGSAKINDGAVKGINIAQFMRDAKKAFIMTENTSESTDFTELSASYTIAQGVLSNSDLAMKSPALRLSGKGTVDLGARTINYRAVPSVVATSKGQGGKDKAGLDIPLIITGPWSKISITPDFAGMVQEGLKDPAKLKENIKDIKDTISDFNSPKDIGKALFGGKKEAAPAATTPATTTPAAEPAATAPAPAAAKEPTKEEKINNAIGGILNQLGK